ncbi:MAG TPA: trimethylamine methyltransferase family protein [Dehalococcoidales bacterium]|nr:trimethylamine methyltransferase family protein [Dehalococcoidales bacterium]
MPREGILVNNPIERLSGEQVRQIHDASIEILTDPGLLCFNKKAAEIFQSRGAEVTSVSGSDIPCWHVKIPEKLVMDAIDSAPKTVTLGARNPDNALVMKGDEAKVFFITGSETNTCLDVDFPTYVNKSDPEKEIRVPEFQPRRGMVADLCDSAHVCEHLETVDGYIRTVNIQDKDINEDNKDVNKFFACLNNTTKHVMSGLTNLKQLDNVVKMAEIIAGGPDKLEENPLISFITCLVKSPLQFVDDTTETFMEVCKRGLPIVVSSSPQAGTSAPIKEAGIMAQINAEVLAGITLGQLVNKGTPVLYGSVPVRARMDTLGDSYGSIETSQYNIDCVQMARFYGLPNYSTSGVCDTKIPGQQSSIERLFSDIVAALSGPQFLHCAFGLLDCNSVFCLLQAVLDDAHFQMIKFFLKSPRINEQELDTVKKQIREVVATPQKMFINYIRPVMRSGEISPPYPFEGDGDSDSVFALANQRLQELRARPVEHIDPDTTARIFREIPGLLPRLNVYKGGK